MPLPFGVATGSDHKTVAAWSKNMGFSCWTMARFWRSLWKYVDLSERWHIYRPNFCGWHLSWTMSALVNGAMAAADSPSWPKWKAHSYFTTLGVNFKVLDDLNVGERLFTFETFSFSSSYPIAAFACRKYLASREYSNFPTLDFCHHSSPKDWFTTV